MKYIIAIITIQFTLFSSVQASENGLELSLFTQSTFKSFGYNYFNNKHGFEIAVPVVLQSSHIIGGYDSNFEPIPDRTNGSVNVDIIYRKHKSTGSKTYRSQRYWYYGGLVRYSYLDGMLSQDEGSQQKTAERATTTKIGLGVNFGYKRFFTMLGDGLFYWGTSLSFGYYVSGESNVELENSYSGNLGYESTDFIDIEISKIGFVF